MLPVIFPDVVEEVELALPNCLPTNVNSDGEQFRMSKFTLI